MWSFIYRFVGLLGFVSSASLFSLVGAHAHHICKTVSDCREKRAQVEERIREIAPQLAPYVLYTDRKRNWVIHEMAYPEAEKLCEDQGTRLPSVRQLALALNPKGVHLVKPSDPYYGIQTIYKTDGSIDFYYDPRTYVRDRELDRGRNHKNPSLKIVSSSTSPENSRWVYYFHLDEGRIYSEEKDGKNPWKNESTFAVRCLGF